MTYCLNTVPKIDGLLCDGENRKDIAKSLNLKYSVWKHSNGVNYHILKYDKEWLSEELVYSVGLLRSLIFKDDGTLVCFAPPKSLPIAHLSVNYNFGDSRRCFIIIYGRDICCRDICRRNHD